jgi:serine/threonine protein kinase
MPLEIGSRLASYEILELLNPGAQPEIYKASDTKQSRTVTIKLLPAHISEHSETKSRIEREMKALSELSHPNICAVHEISREGETDFVVTEYAEGETLEKRLEGGPLALDDVLKFSLAIVDALNKAHRQGIVHRGLRPSNILLTADGVKLLDFGSPKWDTPASTSEKPVTDARSNATLPDVPDEIVRYMAPEQISGNASDARCDIFAFGAVLYEMATGQKAFEGKNRPVLIAAIATLDPDPISKSQPEVPPALDHIAQRCLEKDPDDRWQTSHDLLVQLRWLAEGGDVQLAAARARKKKEKWLLAVIAVAALLVAIGLSEAVAYLGNTDVTEAFQFRVPIAGLNPSDISISPDGKQLAIVAKPNTQESTWLFVRKTGSPEFQRLTGTQDASQPFWSPDSRSIAFVAGGRLKRVLESGGAPKDLAAVPGFTGGAWGSSQVILFGTPKGLFRVPAEGGTPEAITIAEKQETGHFFPAFLPDGQRYFYTVWSEDAARRGVFSGTLGLEGNAKLMDAQSNVQYAAPGYLLYHRDATLFAHPFDEDSLKTNGDALHIADQLDFNPANGRGSFDVSQNGALVYFQGEGAAGGGPTGRGDTQGNFQWGFVVRDGTKRTPVGDAKVFGDMDLSPDERKLAVTQADSVGAPSDIWVIDWMNAGRSYRVTFDPGDNINPVWERPRGDRIAYTTFRKGNADIYIKNANGLGAETPLLETPANESIEDWSWDGKYFVYKSGPRDAEDIWAYSIEDKKAVRVVDGPFRKDEPQLSRDGKWLAYTSNESENVFQVYVVSFPDGKEQKIRVSRDGGGQPRWSKNGRELFFRTESDNRAMVAAITIVNGRIEAGVPDPLFAAPQGGSITRSQVRHQWAVSQDAQRFFIRIPANVAGAGLPGAQVPFQAQNVFNLVGQSNQGQVSSGLTVILNWPASFQKAAP